MTPLLNIDALERAVAILRVGKLPSKSEAERIAEALENMVAAIRLGGAPSKQKENAQC